MKVLLSIKPQFVEKIISGEKTFEYRKQVFKQDISTVVIYATKPVGMIVGEFKVKDILKDSPSNIWSKTKKNSGISKKFFMDYFYERDSAYALEIQDFVKFDLEIDPKDVFLNFTAPQSFMYLDENWI